MRTGKCADPADRGRWSAQAGRTSSHQEPHMRFVRDRFQYLLASTKGLILVAIAMVALETAIFSMLSGPMAEYGVRDFVVRALRMDLIQADREGRIILLYHSIAMAVGGS